MDALDARYAGAGAPVLFLEQNVSSPVGNRIDRWWDSFGTTGSPAVPLTMVDSGRRLSHGPTDFETMYASMVDAELPRPPAAAIRAWWRRDGDTVTVKATVTNQTDVMLGVLNRATVNAMLFERAHVVQSGRFVRAVASRVLRSDLAPGASTQVEITLSGAFVAMWDRADVVVAVDYQPILSETRWDMLQAAVAFAGEPHTISLPSLLLGR